jgi:hypothetical protein
MTWLAALDFLRQHWAKLGYPLAAIFAILWWNKTTICPIVEPEKVVQIVQADCKGKVKIVPQIVDVPGETHRPCPSVEVGFGASSSASLASTPVDAQIQPHKVNTAIFLGAGYFDRPYARLGLGYGSWRVSGIVGPASYGADATFDLWAW